MTIAETAKSLRSHFGTMTANDGSTRVIIGATFETPMLESVRQMVFAADSAGIYHDDAYEMVRDTLDQIADTEPDEISECDRDGLIEVYTGSLMQWLARNWQLADEMKDECGEWPEHLSDIAMATQDYAYGLVLNAIESNWPADETEEETA